MNPIDIPSDWARSAETIASRRFRKLLVLGAVDSGKSTFCAFLRRHLVEAGFKTAMVDADVGQKDLGPPACITLGFLEPADQSRSLRIASFYFVGAVSPARHLLPMVVGVSRLVEAAHAPFVIINTTGLIHSIGRILKGYKIEAIRPDAIVAIQVGHELESLLCAYRNHRIFRLRASSQRVFKTSEQRKAARERAFRDYFEHAIPKELPLNRLIFQRTLLFSGKPLEGTEFLHCERTSEGMLAVGRRPEPRDANVRVIPSGFEENLLCGLSSHGNRGLGLAILQEIDLARNTLSMISPVTSASVQIIQMGELYVNRDGRELDHKEPYRVQ